MPSVAAARILAALARHRTFADLADDDCGEDLCKIATDGVLDAIAREEAPDGSRWADLSDRYERAKSRTHPGRPIGVRDGLMADPAEVAGETSVSRDRAVVAYGVSAEAREEFSWFNLGDPGNNRPPRPCWGFTPASEAEAKEYLARRFKAKVG
jgi:hypothetical protein